MKTILHKNLYNDYDIAIYAIENNEEKYLTENADTFFTADTLQQAINYYNYEKTLLKKNYKKYDNFYLVLSLVTDSDFIPLISENVEFE